LFVAVRQGTGDQFTPKFAPMAVATVGEVDAAPDYSPANEIAIIGDREPFWDDRRSESASFFSPFGSANDNTISIRDYCCQSFPDSFLTPPMGCARGQ
jgi:hypothetical protein